MARNNLIQFRKGTLAQFNSANPTLASGEPGFAIDTNVLKVGDGVTPWSGLLGFTVGSGVSSLNGLTASALVLDGGHNIEVITSGTEIISIAYTGVDHRIVPGISNVNNNGNTFIQDLLFDQYGHVTGVGSVAVTGIGGSVPDNVLVSGDNISLLTNDIGYDTIPVYTLGASGSSHYLFSGPGLSVSTPDPTLYLVRGRTYKFVNSMGAHPFQFQTSSGIGGTAYTSGIDNSPISNATMTWEVRHDTPNTLYYQCTSHSSMQGVVYILDKDSHPTISTASSVDNSNNVFIQDLLFDQYGHVTGVDSVAVTGIPTLPNNILVSGDNISLLTNDAGYATTGELTSTSGYLQGQIDSIPSDTNTFVSGIVYHTGTRDLVLTRNDGVLLTGDFSSVLHSGDNISLLNNNLGYITGLIQDTSPKLGANLDLNSNDITGTGDFNIIGSGIITETMDNHCGFIIKSSGNANGELHVGSCSDANGVPNAMGLRHSSMMGSNDYMICANTDGATFVSSKDTKALTLTAGGNDADTKLELRDVSGPNAGFRFNVNKSNVDLQYNGDNDNNVFYIDASEDSVGIGTNVPQTRLDVSGTITASGGNSNQWNTAYGWGDHSTSGYLVSGSNISLLNNDVPYAISGSHINISAASSVNESGRTYVQDILLDQYGHITGINTATETVVDTNTEYTPSTGLGLNGTEFYITGVPVSLLNGIIDSSNLPSYVDDVLEYYGTSNFPATGVTSIIYVDTSGNDTYRWGGSSYIELTDDTAVWGQIGGTLSNQTDVYNAINAKAASGDNVSIFVNDVPYAISGTHITIANAASNVNNSGNDFVQDLLFDQFGHVTGVVSQTVTDNDVNTFVTGLVFNSGNNNLVLTRNDNVSVTGNLQGVLVSGTTYHTPISAASSSNNADRTYIQNILLDNNGHVTGIATSAETVVDTNVFVTGITYTSSTHSLVLSRNSGSITGVLNDIIHSGDNVSFLVNDANYLPSGTNYHPNISAASSSDNSSNTFIQDILLDSNGHVTGIATAAATGTGAGGGSIDGTGIANYVAKWLDSDTLTSGIIYDDGLRIGIGTPTPSSTLHVFGDVDIEQPYVSQIDFNTTANSNQAMLRLLSHPLGSYSHFQMMGVDSSTELLFYTNNTERMRVDINGNVGIGATAPNYKLDVAGSGSFDALNINDAYTFPTGDGTAGHSLVTDGAGNIIFSGVTGGDGVGITGVVEDATPKLGGNLDTNNKHIVFTSGSTQYANIGLTASDLHINVDDANAESAADRVQFNIDGTQVLSMTSPGGLDTTFLAQKVDINTNGTNRTIFGYSSNWFNQLNNDVDFRVDGDSNDYVLFVDASEDSVGVGTNSPAYKLDVLGETRIMPRSSPSGHTLYLGRHAYQASIKAEGSTQPNQWMIIDSAGSGMRTALNYFVDDDVLLAYGGGNVGVGSLSPSHKLDVTGMGRFVHADGVCGLMVEDTGGSGVHIGDCAYSDGDTYAGMKHSNHTDGQEYMIISAGHSTVVSSKAGTSTYIRAGGNATTYQGVFGTSAFGIGPNANRLRVNSQSVILNNGTGNYDFKVYSENSGTPLIHADAGLHKVGIGTDAPAHKLDVVYPESGCVRFADPAGSGIMIGDCALSSNATYAGMQHTKMVGSYMMVSDGDDTYISARDTQSVFIRGGGNAAEAEIAIHDVVAGGVGIVFNSQSADRDIRMAGTGDANLFRVDADEDRIGIGTATPGYKLDVNGQARIVHADGACGLFVEDGGGSGVHIGDCAYSASDNYAGMKHTAHTNSQEYMILSAGTHTFISAHDGNTVYIRGGGNTTASELQIKDVIAGNDGLIYNENAQDRDVRIEGTGDPYLFKVDASEDRVGIGTNTPGTKLDVDGVITASGGTSTEWNAGYLLAIQASTAGYITGVVEDTTPKLGGNLDLNGSNVTGNGNIDINGDLTTDGNNVDIGSAAYGLQVSSSAATLGNNRLQLLSSETVFNQAAANYDFRVESTGNAHMLFVDAGTERVGVGTSTPATTLDVDGTLTATTLIKSGGTSSQFLKADGSIDTSTYLTSVSNIDTTNFNAATIVTEAEGIGSNDNDTTIPTSAAVKDYVDNNAGKTYTAGSGIVLSGADNTVINVSDDTLLNTEVQAGSGINLVYDSGNGTLTINSTSGAANTTLGSITVTNSQTLFNTNDTFSSGSLAVFVNGVKLVDGNDFTIPSASGFSLTSAAASGDIVDYIAYGSSVASTNLQKTGDTMTGNLTVNADLIVTGYKETHTDNGNTGTSQTIDISSSTLQTYTLTGNCTFTMPTADAGRSFTMFLKTGAGSFTATFTGVKFPSNSAPTITATASRMDILTFYSDGTNWYGSAQQEYHI